jgi:predicted alpha/beta hydrolase family esterase
MTVECMAATKQVLFIQGGGAVGAHDDWDSKLVASLGRALGPGFEIRFPLMPDEADPSYARWAAAIGRETAGLGDGAILIGHSIGGTILINMLAETPPRRQPAGVFLVAAPFIGAGGWPGGDIRPMAGLGARLPRGLPIHLYHGTADETAPVAHADLMAAAIPGAIVHRLPGRDHQLDNDLTAVAADIRALV